VNRRSLAFGLVAAALGMTVGPAIGGTPTRAATGPAEYSIAWGSPGVRCGTLPVLLDWSRPGEQRVSVAVAKGPADDPSRRIGTLFFNPGGPSDGATGYVIKADPHRTLDVPRVPALMVHAVHDPSDPYTLGPQPGRADPGHRPADAYGRPARLLLHLIVCTGRD
jgi:hypothetical protein